MRSDGEERCREGRAGRRTLAARRERRGEGGESWRREWSGEPCRRGGAARTERRTLVARSGGEEWWRGVAAGRELQERVAKVSSMAPDGNECACTRKRVCNECGCARAGGHVHEGASTRARAHEGARAPTISAHARALTRRCGR